MKLQPKITIITCVWNLFQEDRVKTFRQTMESVHTQTYDNIEHIIINNNSTDGTDKLIDEYVTKGWATCFFQQIQGIWPAMNKGIEVATGDFINFMNSDDCFTSEQSVEIAVKALVKNNAEWLYADANRIFDNKELGRWYMVDHNSIFTGICPCHQTMFISLELMREYGGFDLTYPLQCDDRLFLRMLADKRRYVYLPRPLADFRQGGFSSKQTGYQREYSENFYVKFGKDWGMTFDECFSLYAENTFWYKNIKYIKNLAKKIKIKEWREYYLTRHKQFLNSVAQKTYYLFGFFPIFKKRWEPGGGCIYLFGFIPLLKKNRK